MSTHTPSDCLRLAMWSGPRNLSTALMRSFESRRDALVCDEPLYAHYLKVTKLPHPGADEVIARHERDWRAVARFLTGPVPEGTRVFYQKHMSHHLLPEIGRDWLWQLEHCFLIRDPAEVLPSLDAVYRDPRLEDTGLPQQVELFEEVRRRTGRVPPVVDARDLLADPRAMLSRLCEGVGLDFRESMLSWQPGPRATDGVWAKHWYAGVERSTGFELWKKKDVRVPERLRPLLERCRGLYDILHAHRLRV
jgi:hypothetical protein